MMSSSTAKTGGGTNLSSNPSVSSAAEQQAAPSSSSTNVATTTTTAGDRQTTATTTETTTDDAAGGTGGKNDTAVGSAPDGGENIQKSVVVASLCEEFVEENRSYISKRNRLDAATIPIIQSNGRAGEYLSALLADQQHQRGGGIAFNPHSEWQEHDIGVPFLTMFDIYRQPREIRDKGLDELVRIPVKVLNAEFCCPICLGYMKKTSIVMECLHRFCATCIQKCLRLGKKECPSCRIHIPSRRSLRPDPNFDKLIASIYGDIQEREKLEEKEIETLNKARNMNNAYAESRRRGILQQAMYRKRKTVEPQDPSSSSQPGQRRKSTKDAVESVASDGAAPSSSSVTVEGKNRFQSDAKAYSDVVESGLVDFLLRRHPQEENSGAIDRLRKEEIRVSEKMPLRVLKIFLSRKLRYDKVEDLRIVAVDGPQTFLLKDEDTIGGVMDEIYNGGRKMDIKSNPVVFYYRTVSSSI